MLTQMKTASLITHLSLRRKTSFEKKTVFCVGEYAEYGFDQQRLIYGLFVAYGIWCVADVSSVSPSSEQTDIVGKSLRSPIH